MSVAAIPIDEELYSLDGFVQWIDRAELRLDNGDEWQLEPFQREIMADLLSMPRELWVIIPEGNAKTTLAAGAGLFFGDIAQNPWIPIGAASREQAEIMFGQMSVFVEGSDYLKGRFRVYNGYRKISCPGGGRGIKVYPWDPKTGDGVIPYPISLVDELHRHEDLRLYRLWKGKSLKRGASIITTSTAGEPGSEFEEVREAIRAKAGSRKRSGCHLRAEGDGLIYHEWMVPSSDQAKDLKVVKKANPLAQIDIPMLKDKLNSLTLDFGEDWLRLTCNIPSRSGAAAIPEADWDECGTDDEIPAGVPIGVGADFAWLLDTTALVPLWMRDSDYRLFGDPEILVPPRDGTMLAVEDVREAFLRIHERNPISYVVMDMTKAEDTAAWLESELHVQIVERPQRNELFALDYERFMSALAKRQLRHTRHPVFRQHCMNAIARKMPGDRYRFDRPSTSRNTKANRQERRVIDALVAACFVHTMATEGIDSVYEQRGLVTLSL